MTDPVIEPARLEALRQMRLHEMREDQTFAHFVQLACDAFAVPMAGISIVEERHQWFAARTGIAVRALPVEESFCAAVVRQDAPLAVPDLRADPRFRDYPLCLGGGGAPGVRFYAGAPLRARDGAVLGTVCLMDTVPRADFGPREQRLLASMARTVSVRIEANRDTGLVDPMTLAPNRTRFLADIETLQRDPGAAQQVVVLVELCSREYLHDMAKALGQEYADQFLVRAADRLRQAITPQRRLYRVSTNAFAFVHGSDDDAAMEAAFQRMSDFFAVAFDFRGIPHTARIAIGAIRLGQVAGAAELLRALVAVADQLRQRNRAWSFYERSGDEAQQRAFHLLAALGGALARDDQLALHYQPRVDLRTGDCVGFEALLRWDHPLLGMVPPGEFIPLAEKTALISLVTRRVLQMALEQAVRWRAAGHAVPIAVNVSAVDLDQPEFVDDLLRLMARCGADPRCIEIECTEGALSTHPERFREHLHRLRAEGVRLAIDDFGTGYSNLAYLKDIPAQLVKIDRSFVRSVATDDRDRIIVTTLIRMARELGMRTVAEGIETPELMELLAGWGCDEAQGYWIARPMPVAAAERWLAAHAARPRGA